MIINKPIPKYFYRYYSFDKPEHIESIFRQSKLYFPPPSEFNDPFDCKLKISYEASDEQKRKWIIKQVEIRHPEYSTSEKDKKVNESVKEIRRMTPEYMSNNVLPNFRDEIGVLCLSEVRDSILMWAHYTSGYKGFCLEFINPVQIQLFAEALKVGYRENYPLCKFFADNRDEKLIASLLTKSKLWKYEKEWRIIKHNSGPGEYPFPKELLTGIIFGSEMKKEHSELIINWATKYSFTPDYYIVKQHKERYQLVIERLNA